MKNIEKVREYVANRQAEFIARLRLWLSSTDNAELVELLRDKSGDVVLASATETIMVHLGHGNPAAAVDQQSSTRKLVARVVRGTK